jgi:hypothetical protein
MKSLSERIFLPNGGDVPSGFRLINLIRLFLFSPLFIVIWMIYVCRIAWIVLEIALRKHPSLSWSNAIKAARALKCR